MNILGWLLFGVMLLAAAGVWAMGGTTLEQKQRLHADSMQARQRAIDQSLADFYKKAEDQERLLTAEQERTQEFATKLQEETERREKLQTTYNELDAKRQDRLNAVRNANDLVNDLNAMQSTIRDLESQIAALRKK